MGSFSCRNSAEILQCGKKCLSGFEEWPADVQGGLVSLVFNRGTSMEGDRRREMRVNRDLVPQKDVKGIAEQIRK